MAAQGLSHDALVRGAPSKKPSGSRKPSRSERAEEDHRRRKKGHKRSHKRHLRARNAPSEVTSETPVLAALMGDSAREEATSEEASTRWADASSEVMGVPYGVIDDDLSLISSSEEESSEVAAPPSHYTIGDLEDDYSLISSSEEDSSEVAAPPSHYTIGDLEDDYSLISSSEEESSEVAAPPSHYTIGDLEDDYSLISSSEEDSSELAGTPKHYTIGDLEDEYSLISSSEEDSSELAGTPKHYTIGDLEDDYSLISSSDEESSELIKHYFTAADFDDDLEATNASEEEDDYEVEAPSVAPKEPKSLWQAPYSGKNAEGRFQDLAKLGKHYKGEGVRAEWRVNELNDDGGKLGNVRTVYYDEAQRDAHRIDVDANGLLTQGNDVLDTSGARGNRLDSGRDAYIFAMSPDGQFQGADQMAENRANLREEKQALKWIAHVESMTGGYTPSIEEVKERFGDHVDAKRYIHHSSFFGGEDVAGAGEITAKEGKTKRITPNSGHYKPGLNETTNVVNELSGRGANLDDALVEVNRLDDNGKVIMDGHNTKSETFHSGEILAAQGDYHALMNKKNMLGQIKALREAQGWEDEVERTAYGIYRKQGKEAAIAYADSMGYDGFMAWSKFAVKPRKETSSPTEILARATGKRPAEE